MGTPVFNLKCRQTYVCPERASREQQEFFEITRNLLASGDLPSPGSYLTNDDIGVPILATCERGGVSCVSERL